MTERPVHDVVVIGAGQAGLAIGYYLRRTDLDWIILDAEDEAGAAWRHTWDSLHLFSPAQWSMLPGWPMPRPVGTTPSRDEVIAYFTAYEARYKLPIRRPVRANAVRRVGDLLHVETDHGTMYARAVVSATGTWGRPFIPTYPDQRRFQGVQVHSAQYRTPAPFVGQTVLIVGGGNSGAQILAEVSEVAETIWVTPEAPHFLPDDVDGRILFQRATERIHAEQEQREGRAAEERLASIVMVPPVRAARDRGVLEAVRPFVRFTPGGVIWPDGQETRVDAVIWCTGFRPMLHHLNPLGVIEADGRVALRDTRSRIEPSLWLLGYGDWTGAASGTILGVGRYARATAAEIATALSSQVAGTGLDY